MKLFNALLILALVFTFSCNDESSISENVIPDEMMAASGHSKTIKFREASGIMEYFKNAGYCKDFGGGTLVMITGTGKASSLGNFSVVNTVCQDKDGNAISPLYGTLTMKNGSEINTILTGIAPDPDDPSINHYYYTVLGGSGRFDKLTGGSITMFGVVDYVNNVWNLEGEGILEF